MGRQETEAAMPVREELLSMPMALQPSVTALAGLSRHFFRRPLRQLVAASVAVDQRPDARFVVRR
jgi:hypothetical protein